MEELINFIENDLQPEEEWWKDSTPETLLSCGTKMLNKGMDIEEVKHIIETLYYAISSEFGN